MALSDFFDNPSLALAQQNLGVLTTPYAIDPLHTLRGREIEG